MQSSSLEATESLVYNLLVHDASKILREIRTEIMQLDEILRWENNDEINRDRAELIEWRNWILSQLMPRQRKKPTLSLEEEYYGLW